MRFLVSEDRWLVWYMVGVSLLFHVLVAGIVLFASSQLFKPEEVIYSVVTVDLVNLAQDPEGPVISNNGQQTDRGNRAPGPTKEVKKEEVKAPAPEIKEALDKGVKEEEVTTPAPKPKETPKVEENVVPDTPKPQPKKTEKQKTSAPSKTSVNKEEDRMLSVEEVRKKRLDQLAGLLPDKRLPAVPGRESTPTPREIPSQELEEENFSPKPQEAGFSDKQGERITGSLSLEFEGSVRQGSLALVSYLEVVTRTIKNRWLPPSGKGRGIIEFTISKTGEISDIYIVKSSGDKNLDESILRAVEASNPLQELPVALRQELDRLNDSFLRVKFHFGRRLS